MVVGLLSSPSTRDHLKWIGTILTREPGMPFSEAIFVSAMAHAGVWYGNRFDGFVQMLRMHKKKLVFTNAMRAVVEKHCSAQSDQAKREQLYSFEESPATQSPWPPWCLQEENVISMYIEHDLPR